MDYLRSLLSNLVIHMVASNQQKDKRIYKLKNIRFFGGDARLLLHNIDPEELMHDIIQLRIDTKQFIGDISIYRMVDGHKLKFTQTQMRAMLLHVEEVAE